MYFVVGKTQEEGLRRVEELKKELCLLKETGREENKRWLQLQEEHASLTEELAKERVGQTFSYLPCSQFFTKIHCTNF